MGVGAEGIRGRRTSHYTDDAMKRSAARRDGEGVGTRGTGGRKDGGTSETYTRGLRALTVNCRQVSRQLSASFGSESLKEPL